ncbi:hypothetical protein PAPYR_9721 [Paratrimastix pyriformis]|uniref:Uncharacterized protein n=1 Tax=Paratrimastix pyriformis TaxID=342808 RepID=A0ABQ8UAF2_9EUKA|nr:hypothetical protein PAPYR_9721 [Paratrimastix pyriformis]
MAAGMAAPYLMPGEVQAPKASYLDTQQATTARAANAEAALAATQAALAATQAALAASQAESRAAAARLAEAHTHPTRPACPYLDTQQHLEATTARADRAEAALAASQAESAARLAEAHQALQAERAAHQASLADARAQAEQARHAHQADVQQQLRQARHDHEAAMKAVLKAAHDEFALVLRQIAEQPHTGELTVMMELGLKEGTLPLAGERSPAPAPLTFVPFASVPLAPVPLVPAVPLAPALFAKPARDPLPQLRLPAAPLPTASAAALPESGEADGLAADAPATLDDLAAELGAPLNPNSPLPPTRVTDWTGGPPGEDVVGESEQGPDIPAYGGLGL